MLVYITVRISIRIIVIHPKVFYVNNKNLMQSYGITYLYDDIFVRIYLYDDIYGNLSKLRY